MLLTSASKASVRDTDGDAAGDDAASGRSGHNSSSPVPAAAPSLPFIIGKSFMKQYYQVLTTAPEEILKFYKAETSTLCHSLEASTRTEPLTLDAQKSPLSIFGWTMNADKQAPGIRFDFEHGAIDAQETINGGILLVVTGFMYLPCAPEIPKPFVHTFVLLNGSPPGKKKHFYVHNDVLRVMSESHVSTNEELDEVDKTGDTASARVESVVEQQPVVAAVAVADTVVQELETLAISQDPPSSLTPSAHLKDTLEGSSDLVLSSSVANEGTLDKPADATETIKGDEK